MSRPCQEANQGLWFEPTRRTSCLKVFELQWQYGLTFSLSRVCYVMKGTWSCLMNNLKMLTEQEEWITLMKMTTKAIKITDIFNLDFKRYCM